MSDEVTSFLRDVEQLKGRRTEEDEARSRELEEKILQERRERQARREERARSISPQKSSPANTPPPSSNRNRASQGLDGLNLDPTHSPPRLGSPSSPQTQPRDFGGNPNRDAITMGSTEFSASPTKENESPFDSGSKRSSMTVTSPSSGAPASRTLSWQRRPTSQASERPKSRPLSMVAAENAAARSSTSLPDQPEPAAASRDQIAQALGSKDPSWFRQTPDRGQSSAAYRRSQVEDEARTDVSAMKTELPGMSRASPTEPEKSPSDRRPSSPAIHGRVGSPLTLTPSQRLDPPGVQAHEDNDTSPQDRKSMMSPSLPSGRASPTRPLSPTKGMGGFVQSAMMKRTDSVKRWSVNSPQGLQRADSVAGNMPQPQSRPVSMYGRESTSRPTSSHEKEKDVPADSTRSDEVAPLGESKDDKQQEDDKTTPPSSPSKTMDPRRWSPSKSSSWLEAALNKPESPKPKPTPPLSNQPAWMVELSKNKAQKTSTSSTDVNRASSIAHKHEVRVGGLMRSSPMGTGVKPTPLSGATFHSPSSSIGGDKASVAGLRSNLQKLGQAPSTAEPSEPGGGVGPNSSSAAAAEAPEKRSVSNGSKPKPETPPKKGFRANLKTFQSPSTSTAEGDGNELKNVFGALRKTKTQNYVAPDELKSNILRGKAALNVTGGPKPSERKDEFKDAILQKKAEFKKAQAEGRSVTRAAAEAAAAVEKPIPEGLAKKMELGRSNTLTSSKGASASSSSITTEAPKGRAFQPARSSSSVSSSSLSKREPEDPVTMAEVTKTKSPEPVRSPNAEKQSPTIRPKPRFDAPTAVADPPVRLIGQKVGGGGGRLADRFSPALAGIIGRGPPGMGSGKTSDGSTSNQGTAGSVADSDQAGIPGPQLTHMTKGRARGPRRKAPTNAGAAVAVAVESEQTSPSAAAEMNPTVASRGVSTGSSVKSPGLGLDETSRKLPQRPISRVTTPASAFSDGVVQLVDSSKKRLGAGEEPVAPAGTVIALVDSSRTALASTAPPLSPTKKIHEQVAAIAARGKQQQQQQPPSEPQSPERRDEAAVASQPSSPKKLDMKRMSRFLDESTRPAEPAAGSGEPPRPLSPQKTGGGGGGGVTGRLPDPPPESPSRHHRRQPSRAAAEEKRTSGSVGVAGVAAIFQAQAQAQAGGSEAASASAGETVRSRSRSPTKVSVARPLPMPTSPEPATSTAAAAAATSAGARPLPLPKKKDIISPSTPPLFSPQSRPLPTPVATTPPSHPLPAPRITSPPAPHVSPRSPTRSPTRYASEVSQLLNEFFGPHRPGRDYRVDAAEILTRRPPALGGGAQSPPRIQTQSAQLFRIGADGKKQAVPAHQERVLFEREMYLCAHTFVVAPGGSGAGAAAAAGRRVTEVYFWVGDEVPPAAAEDAVLFVNREARALSPTAGGRVLRLAQGKETAEFLQALGGVVIVRRGSSNKYDSLAPHMLCGRRHLGQMTFDEVDLSPRSLCSGFAYLVTQGGRCHLWKGKGADVDELSCARLIGMDSSLTGELVEVGEGTEPEGFWRDVFGGAGAAGQGRELGQGQGHGRASPGSADHWRLKPNYQKYCARLFRSDAGGREQIVEIHPFSQADLDPASIYVLDAFFEMYIVVGYGAQSQYGSFRNALDFAQEYAILASGMEDRPFVPISTVVLEGIPRDLKSVFRKWRDAASPTRTNVDAASGGAGPVSGLGSPLGSPGLGGPQQQQQHGLRRGRSLRIVPLNQALMALAE